MDVIREKLQNVDLEVMEAGTGIQAQALRAFRRGAVLTPRIDTVTRLVEYLMPDAKIYWDDHDRPYSELSAKKLKLEKELDDINSKVQSLTPANAG